MFSIIKDIVTSSGTLEWKLSNATLEFEIGLLNAFNKVFFEARAIGCLFHFKQALFREAQAQGLTKSENKEETLNIISNLGSLCWNGNSISIENKFHELESKYSENIYNSLIEYYKNNWLDRLKSGLIDYSDIDDTLRSNSVLEQYNSHVKNFLPRSPTWAKFIEFLINEEANYVKESFQAEQKGEIALKSTNFGKTYLPKTLKKKNQVQTKLNDNKDNNSQETLSIKIKKSGSRKRKDPTPILDQTIVELPYQPNTKRIKKTLREKPL